MDASSHGIKRSHYMFICKCNKCGEIVTKRAVRVNKKIGVCCPNCTFGLYRKHKNSSYYYKKENIEYGNCLEIIRNTTSEYTLFNSDMESMIELYMDSDKQSYYTKKDIINIFGKDYFR